MITYKEYFIEGVFLMENKLEKEMNIGKKNICMSIVSGASIAFIVLSIVALNCTLDIHAVVLEKVEMLIEKYDIYIIISCGISMILVKSCTWLFEQRSFIKRILSSKSFMKIIFIITMVLLYNYMLSITMLKIKTININYEYVHGLLMWALIIFMTPKGDKMVRMSISLYSIATIVLIIISTLNLHIANIGQLTLFLDLELLWICEMCVSAVIKYVLLKICLYVVKWAYRRFKC